MPLILRKLALAAILVLSGCDREPSQITEEAPEERKLSLLASPWVDVPTADADILQIGALVAPFETTRRCFGSSTGHVVCLGRVETHRENSRGEPVPYSHEVPGFLVGDGQALHYVPVPNFGFQQGERRFNFHEGDLSPALIIDESGDGPASARVECGDRTLNFAALSEEESARLFEDRPIKVAPPRTSVVGGRRADGQVLVLWTGQMPGVPQQRILAIGTPPNLEVLEIKRSRTEPGTGAMHIELEDGRNLFLGDATGGDRFEALAGQGAAPLTPLTDLEWDAFFAAMATPKLIRYQPTTPLGACSLLKEALQPPS